MLTLRLLAMHIQTVVVITFSNSCPATLTVEHDFAGSDLVSC